MRPVHIFTIHAIIDDLNSSLSSPAGDVAATGWRKSSFSTYNGNCVEIGFLGGKVIGVRDTKDRGHGPVLSFAWDEWIAFVDGVKAGKFDSI